MNPPADIFTVDAVMHKEQRARLAAKLPAGSAALLQAPGEVPIHDTDTNHVFRQESYFYYLFGHNEPDLFGIVAAESGHSILFIPRLPQSYAVWMGELPTPEAVKALTGVDEVHFSDEMVAIISARGYKELHVLDGVNTDSGLRALTPKFEGQEAFNLNKSLLFHVLSTQRVYKTPREIELLKRVAKISSDAHVAVMQATRPGMGQHQLESLFLHHCYYNGGCRLVSYTCICATGHCGAVLHYPQNNRIIRDGEMALLDMGAQLHCYASDITCSFPVNGKFTPKQSFVYNAVLDAQRAVLKALKPGVSWVDMQRLALHVMMKALLKEGLIHGDEKAIEESHLMYTFMPHGLGHLLGMDVHDVGGYPEGGVPRPTELSCCKLRTARVLEASMYLTVEPGLYFVHALLEKAFADPVLKTMINEKLIRDEYWYFGGVRIEDDVLITEKGCVNFTCCPRGEHEIELVMSGSPWKAQPKEYVNTA